MVSNCSMYLGKLPATIVAYLGTYIPSTVDLLMFRIYEDSNTESRPLR